MSNQDDRDSLLGLFSTRVSSRASGAFKAPTDAKVDAGGQSNAQEKGNAEPSSMSTVVSNNTRTSGNSTVIQRPTSAALNMNTTAAAAASKSKLSALATTVMREARRELGSDQSNSSKDGQPVAENTIALAVDKVLKRRGEALDDLERANIIIHLQKDLLGWGVLQPLVDNREVTDIHVYDYNTVVLQRGKVSEPTGLHWPNHASYVAFLDRLLLRLGKSLSTQQHTVDAAFPNGIRVCAVHESVCGQRGPLLCIRVPRMSEVKLENLVNFQVAPPLIVNYLAALIRSGHATMMVAGETGTGKTTLIKCLGTQFGASESIVAVEDTPELNFQHQFFRSLVSRPPNAEGVGEVTLQEHIKTTLRMTPTRVILGEMRTPFAAEAFLESAQTGHVGMSTVHARNARETLVRLESLLGRAQKSVAIDIIRQQIALAVDSVVWLFREKETGRPRVGEIIEVGHFVEGVIQIRPMFTLVKTGEKPAWRVDSYASNFDELLQENGIFLGDAPQEIGFGNYTDTGKGKSR